MIRDRYEPTGSVGRGGEGEVLRAMDRLHGRPVALKIRPVRSADDREAILREAKVLRTLRPHAGITLVREDFFDGDRYVMVMDWVDGVTLSRLVADEGALPLERVATLLEPVAAALDHIHRHDPPVAHGDVKPANIVRASDGHIVLVDFGLAGAAAPRMATSGFTAPEVARGEPLGPAADVYSLAATALVLLTGDPPTMGARPALPATSRAEARRLERALSKGLHPDPRKRPPSAPAFLALLAPRGAPNNLPTALTSFVGRRAESRALARALSRARLVTLAGPGGVGKTRLACAAGLAVRRSFPDGVWLARIGTLPEPDLVPAAIAEAIGVPQERTRSIEQAVIAFLRSRSILLILDDCERILEAAAATAQRLLEACEGLRVLATSREPLGVPGEHVMRIDPLAVADTGARALARCEAVRLLRDRAGAAGRPFRVTGANARAVAEICRRLDGLPLAIELAAARLETFSPGELAARLDDRFALLAGGRADPVAHHRTLRAAIDWSYDLLGEDERALLRRLAVFPGAFDAPAVEHVCTRDGGDRAETAGLLDSLVRRSLVSVERGGGTTRYRLLESVHAYAIDRLVAAGEEKDARRRHLAWVLDLARRAEEEIAGPDQGTWLERLAQTADDARAALRWAVEEGNAGRDAVDLAAAFAGFWLMRGHPAEGRSWVDRALQAGPDAEETVLARALNAAGNLALRTGDLEAARVSHTRALELRRRLGAARHIVASLNNLGLVLAALGDRAGARTLHEESLEVARELGDRRYIYPALINLIGAARERGDLDEARRLAEEALALARAAGDGRGIAYSLDNLASVLADEDRSEEALALHRESLGILHEIGDLLGAAVCLALIAEREVARGRADRGARIIAAAFALRDEIGAPVPEEQREGHEKIVAAARGALGDEAYERTSAEGAAMVLDRAVTYARTDAPGDA